MKKPNKLKDEHIEYLNELLSIRNFNMYGSLPLFMNSFPTLNDEESEKILQYWLNTYNKIHKEEVENFEVNENDHNSILKIFAITYSNKMFRVVGEFKNINEDTFDIIKILPFSRIKFCNFIYNITDKKILKYRYGTNLDHNTIMSLFNNLPLITVDDFIEEFDETFNNKGD